MVQKLETNTALVTVDWLEKNLKDPNLIVLDASLPKPKSKPEDLPHADLQIKGARFFDIDHTFSETSSPLPHMMPSQAAFEKEAQKLGISASSTIIVYDQLGVYSAPRAWWMFKAMGHESVFVLDGGFPLWMEKAYPVEKKQRQSVPDGDFKAQLRANYFVHSAYTREQIHQTGTCILDARSEGRFNGTEPEPRAGLRSGHIPGSKSLPFQKVLNGYQLQSKSELQTLLQPFKLGEKHVICSCGSGLTACIILLAAYVAGHKNLSVYDGSWSEWGMPSNELPVEA